MDVRPAMAETAIRPYMHKKFQVKRCSYKRMFACNEPVVFSRWYFVRLKEAPAGINAVIQDAAIRKPGCKQA